MKLFYFILFLLPSFVLADFGQIPVQHGGRIKPFDTLARESVRLVYGKESYKKKDPKKLVMTWFFAPEPWVDVKIIQVKNRELKERIELEMAADYFSLKEIFTNPNLPSLIQDLKSKNEKGLKLNPFDQAVQRLEAQVGTMQAFRDGAILKFEPTDNFWKSPKDFSDEYLPKFAKIRAGFLESLKDESGALDGPLNKASAEYLDELKKEFPDYSLDFKRNKAETLLNSSNPFRWAWIAYLLSLIFIFAFWLSKKKSFLYGFIGLLVVGFLLHCFGFGLRVFISGRPPVSNMYETVLWVPFGTLIFGVAIAWWNKSLKVLVGAAIVALFCLILADISPVILDPSIQPLEPVLRSNFWLLTHVLTITISYSAFFLAFILGDFSLVYHLNEKKNKQAIVSITRAMYRSIQIGVLLLAIGVILGGVWADYSWGRFWGWDPKETWAFIALMGYLAILHGRLIGWVKNFGMAVWSVLSFSLVIMAWYGVNFWLGAGLHSYGFGAGGVEYVSIFVGIQIFFALFVAFYRQKKIST